MRNASTFTQFQFDIDNLLASLVSFQNNVSRWNILRLSITWILLFLINIHRESFSFKKRYVHFSRQMFAVHQPSFLDSPPKVCWAKQINYWLDSHLDCILEPDHLIIILLIMRNQISRVRITRSFVHFDCHGIFISGCNIATRDST